MSDSAEQEYGKPLKVARGDQYARRPERSAAEIALDRRMRAAYARCQGADGTVPSRAVYDIRCGQQKPWSKTAKRAIEMFDAGVPVADIKVACALEVAEWIDELAAQRPDPNSPAPVALRRAA